ncbi:MAG TPA: hypothetical protein PLC99_20550 [Verrucomicrobiota bacterium]|nr:hypothetical protein [Verrucomicrobiota bacterium]
MLKKLILVMVATCLTGCSETKTSPPPTPQQLAEAAKKEADAEAARQQRVQADKEVREKYLAEVNAAAQAFERDRKAIEADVSALELQVRKKKWDAAEVMAEKLFVRFKPVSMAPSPIASEPWVVELQARLEEQRALVLEVVAKKRALTEARASGIQVDALTLWRAYDSNEVAADAKFKDKTLIVVGRIQSIDKDFMDNIVLVLRGPDEFSSLHAYLSDDEKEAASRLSKGAKIELKCRGDGRTLGDPVLQDCALLK